MIPRVLEPEAMDTTEEASEYDAMDHSAVNLRFAIDFLAAHGSYRGGTILDVGTGTALIPIQIALADAGAKILAVDLAAAMLAVARRNVAAAGLADRILLERVDAKGLSYADGTMEAVISNSIVHHIPHPAPAMREMVRQVAPGGTLFVRDLARPSSVADIHHLVHLYAGGESDRARSLFADSLHAALTLEEVQSIVQSLDLPSTDVVMTSDRHWTWCWRREP